MNADVRNAMNSGTIKTSMTTMRGGEGKPRPGAFVPFDDFDYDYELLTQVKAALRNTSEDITDADGWRGRVDVALRSYGQKVDETLQEQYANSAHPTGRGPLVILSNGHAIWERDNGLEITRWGEPGKCPR